MAGMKVQVVEVDKDGNIDLSHLKALVRKRMLLYKICVILTYINRFIQDRHVQFHRWI